MKATILVCFWCQKDKNKNEVVSVRTNKKTPQRTVFDYTPCETCKSDMGQGASLIEVQEKDNGTAPIQRIDGHTLYPTGRWAVVLPEAVERMFPGKGQNRMLFIDIEVFDNLGLEEKKCQQSQLN